MSGPDAIHLLGEKRPSASQLGSQLRLAWGRGDRVTASEILSGSPELQGQKSVVLDLAYEEYCARIAAGDPVEIGEFAARFSSYEKSVYRLLEVAQLLNRDPRFATDFGRVDWPQVGEEFLGYELLECIGRGAFAKVFLAADTALGGRRVVVKVTTGGRAEAEILGTLNHSNVVPVYSVKWDPARSLAALCMPYYGRITFADLIDQLWADHAGMTGSRIAAAIQAENAVAPNDGRIDRWLRSVSFSTAVIYLFAELAEGLAHAHARGIAHGDLKPSNVLLSCQGRPMLLDFNLSRSEGQRSWVGGTLAYMAPEQIREVCCGGATSSDRHHADIFSMGVIFYQLLTGQLPFGAPSSDQDTGQAARELLARHELPVAPIRSLNPKVDLWLEAIVHKCIEGDSYKRPATAASLANQLRAQLRPPQRACRWVAAHKVRASVLAAVCGTGMAVGATYVAMRPAYDLRQLEHARTAFAQGQYPRASSLAAESLRANPNLVSAYDLRAKSLIAQGRFSAAFEDFQKLERLSPNARWIAGQGYCLAMGNWHREAIALYKEALKRGFSTADVHNNLGYSFRQLGNPQDAIAAFNKAIEIDSEFGTAYRNRALAKMQAAQMSGLITPDDALDDIHAATAFGPICGELYVETAAIAASTAHQTPDRDRHILACLKNALEFGAPGSVLDGPAFVRLKTSKSFSQLSQVERRKGVPYSQSLVATPRWLQEP